MTGRTANELEDAPLDERPPWVLHHQCTAFLNREAELLDAWELNEWFDLLTDDVEYYTPVRVTREKGGNEFSDVSSHFAETKESIRLRISRYDTDYAWSENPPSRLRHFVSNVRVGEVTADEVDVKSNLQFVRSQGDSTKYDFLSGERQDRLRLVDGSLELCYRRVLLDHTVLDIEYISTFL